MLQVAIKDLKKYYGANLILSDISLEIIEGEKIGLIGKNGSGKSTLFKIISGIENHEEGYCTKKKDLKIGYQIQDFTPYLEYTGKEVIFSPFKSVLEIETELKEALIKIEDYEDENYEKHLEEYGAIQEKFELADGYRVEEKVKRVREGLSIPLEFFDKKIKNLSGGEKNRIFLAKALVDEPDLLLLDEPTNHLDLKSLNWLEDFIKNYKKSCLIISHDRYFLDKTIEKIYDLTPTGIETYIGNYSYYTIEKERRFEKAMEEFLAQQKEIKRMEDAIRRFRHWGSNADNPAMFIKAENMRKRIERMEKLDKPTLDKNINMNMEVSSRSGKVVLRTKNLSKKIEDKILFENIDFDLYTGERVGIIGKNGSGKSTFIRMIMDEVEGVTIGSNVKYAYLDQNLTFEDYSCTLIDTFRKDTIVREEHIRRELAKYHFYDEDMNKTIENLSGGQKARLKLAIMVNNGFNLLILDEPTNHLDLYFKEVFEDTLLNFHGSILFISHDRYFLNKISSRLIELKNKNFYEYLGNYDYYLEKNLEVIEEKKVNKEDTRFRDNQLEKEREKRLKTLKKEEENLLNILSILEKEEKNFVDDYIKLAEIHSKKVEVEEQYELILEEIFEVEGL